MKVWMHAPREAWIVDRIVAEFKVSNADIIVERPDDAQMIWAPAGWCVDQLVHYNKPILSTVHHLFAEKPEQARHVADHDRFVTAYHVPNVRTMHELQKITSKPIYVVPYWINSEMWFPITPGDREMARRSLGIKDSDFVLGSFQRDTEGSCDTTPKREKGPDIFCDYAEVLNSRNSHLIVLLSGYRRQYVMSRLLSKKIKTLYVEMAPSSSMRWLYSALDLYAVSSRCEGGPQALLECAACCVPIISTPVGMAEQLLAPESVSERLELAEANIDVARDKSLALLTPHAFIAYRDMFKHFLENR